MIKDLIYHCCPLKSNDLWERNCEQLLARIDIFDGRRVIAVSTGEAAKLHDFEVVKEKFHGRWCQFIKVQNDRRLREVASFRQLLDTVYTLHPNAAVFYAHTKGNSTADGVEGATYWRNVMYHVLLDSWQDRMKELEQYPAVGCNKMCWASNGRGPYPSGLMHGNWMFAGTFFWFRARDVFSKPNWHLVPNDRYGAEAWLSGMFEWDECHSCFQPWNEKCYPPPNPYDPIHYVRSGMPITDIELTHPSYSI